MGLVPPRNNFINKIRFSISNFRYARYSTTSYINIIVMAQYYQPNMTYIVTDGVNKSLNTQIWTPIRVKGVIEAYATKVAVSPSVIEIIHTNTEALMSVVVYGVAQRIGYIHPGRTFYSTLSKQIYQCVSFNPLLCKSNPNLKLTYCCVCI